MDDNSLNQAIDGTSYGRNSGNDAAFKLGQANMFLTEFFSRRDEKHLLHAAQDTLAEAREKALETLRQIEKAERGLSILGESETEKLQRTTVDLNVIAAIPQQPQVQSSTADQLKALELAANRLGLYDAADAIRYKRAAA